MYRFPHDLYANDPHYVPMLYMEQEALLNPVKSPFFKHSNAEYFIAEKDGKIVGRIAAILNRNHIAFSGKKEGFFGFFDVINDFDTAKMLLDAAKKWLNTEGVANMIGPANFSTNETVGVLVDNFSEPAFVMTTYNAPYYATLLEQYGCVKFTDLLCWDLRSNNLPNDKIEFVKTLEKRLSDKGVIVRKINMNNYTQEIENFLPIYNQSWSENTGFVPMTDAEVRQIAKDLRPIINPDFVFFAEKEGKIIGVALCVPNINEVLISLKRGRLFPFGFIKLLRGLKKIKSLRIMALGTLQEYRRLGVDAVFYVKIMLTALEKGIERGEASWILENNTIMNRAIENIHGKVYRKYRLYQIAV
ncbi:MAG: hypothetical protein HC817_12675 [Saprospiraceae bacterium]|nr:hypothetical protein [Saprospiraceae bacterium]